MAMRPGLHASSPWLQYIIGIMRSPRRRQGTCFAVGSSGNCRRSWFDADSSRSLGLESTVAWNRTDVDALVWRERSSRYEAGASLPVRNLHARRAR